MNSYTSSSESHRRFVFWLIIPVVGLYALGIYLQPLYGDLTRIGSYAEKEFGWNSPQLEFQKPLSDMGRYKNYYDVVVLGDSFATTRPRLQWQNYLVAANGWSMVTLDANKISLEEVLENTVFRQTPPKIFILGTVERELPRRLASEKYCEFALPIQAGVIVIPPLVTAHVNVKQLHGLAKLVDRQTAWGDINFMYVRDYLWNGFLRTVFGNANTDAVKVALSTEAPFSSRNKTAMLVYKDDFQKMRWWHDMGMLEITCRIEKIRKQVEANGKTRFILMVAPDKLTAYSDYLLDKELRDISVLSELASQLPGVMPRLDLALTSAIRDGEQDVYLPDDTHWGSSGNKIVAETLDSFLHQP